MKGPKLWLVLAASAIAVGFQNYIFFSGLETAAPAGSEEWEETFDDDEIVFEDPLESLEPSTVNGWIESLPAPGRNPFLTQVEADALGGPITTALPRLAGTLWSPDRRVAWIGGHPHSEGDWVGEHRLERIEPSGVVLRQGESLLHLRAKPEDESPDEDPSDEN